mgnify:CR=1 FL=1
MFSLGDVIRCTVQAVAQCSQPLQRDVPAFGLHHAKRDISIPAVQIDRGDIRNDLQCQPFLTIQCRPQSICSLIVALGRAVDLPRFPIARYGATPLQVPGPYLRPRRSKCARGPQPKRRVYRPTRSHFCAAFRFWKSLCRFREYFSLTGSAISSVIGQDSLQRSTAGNFDS